MSRLLSNGRLIALAIALIVVAGASAVSLLPRLEDPSITNRFGLIITHLPGASAERTEALISEKIESELREMSEIKHIISNSRAGISAVAVTLADAVVEDQTQAIWAEVRDKVTSLSPEFPRGASVPTVDTDRGHTYTWIAGLVWTGSEKSADMYTLGRYAKELESQLRSLPGTDFVSHTGRPAEEVQVKLDIVKAAAVGLDVQKVAAILAASDAKVAAGELNNGERRLSVEIEGGFSELERIRRVPLLTFDSGGSLQLQDIAEVYIGEPENPRNIAIISGRRGVTVNVRMMPTVRGDQWTQLLRERVAVFSASLPEEIEVQELFVQERYNAVRLGDLVNNILLGFSFIFVILLFTMGIRSATVVVVSLPLTMLFSLACMRLNGIPIHQMSVTGLIVALGIMVDNAIVVTDTVGRYREKGYAYLAATSKAVRHLWVPLLGSTLTTILTFSPTIIIGGPMSEFVGPISQSVIFSLVGSWLISLFIIAPIAGRWLDGKPRKERNWSRLSGYYNKLLTAALNAPRRTMLLCCVLPVAGFIASGSLPEQFFPDADRDMFDLELYLPAGSSIHKTRAASEELTTYLERYEEIESLHWFVGSNSPKFYYNLDHGKDGMSHYAQAMLSTRDFKAANHLIPKLQRELSAAFPEYQFIVRRLQQGPPAPAPVEFRLYGSNLDTLKALGDELRRIALATEGVVEVRDTLGESTPKMWLKLDESVIQRTGVGLADVSAILSSSVDGVVSSSLLDNSEQLPVRVSAKGLKGTSADIFMSVSLSLPNGSLPLSAVASSELRPAKAVLARRDGRRVNTVQVYIRDGLLPSQALALMRQAMIDNSYTLPTGYSIEIGGEAENRSETVSDLIGTVGIIAVLLLVTVVLSFNSFRLSAIVFAVAIQSVGMGMLSLWTFSYPFAFTAIIGLMGLMGLAINAAIVIMTELKSTPMAMAGDRTVIINTVATCTRHIASTTATTVVGLLPLIIAGGGFWPPFAIVLAGGTVLTTILSLLFVPAAFLVLRRPYILKYFPPSAREEVEAL